MAVYFDQPFLHVPPMGVAYLRFFFFFLECIMTERRGGNGLWDEQLYCQTLPCRFVFTPGYDYWRYLAMINELAYDWFSIINKQYDD